MSEQVMAAAISPTASQGSPNHKVSTLEDVRRLRTVLCELPSGLVFRIRPVSMDMHAQAGDLPDRLRQFAIASAMGDTTAPAQLLEQDKTGETLKELAEYHERIVRMMVVEPDLSNVDMTELLPVDYDHLRGIALRQIDTDALGRRLWGEEPLSRWRVWREFHDCPSSCPACDRVLEHFGIEQ